MKTALDFFWNWMIGKKRTFALIYWSILIPSMAVIWPDGFHTPFSIIFNKCMVIFGLIFSAVGLGHAAIRTDNQEETK